MDNAAMNSYIQVLVYIPKSEIIESYGNSVFNF